MKIMMSTVGCRLGVLLMVCAIAATGCPSQENAIVCEAEGVTYLCPEHTVCGGVQRLCIDTRDNACGNGQPDGDEECDDGNLKNGDGCSKDCKREVCGNGITDKE